MGLARVGRGIRRKDGYRRLVRKLRRTVKLLSVAARREEVLQVRHVRRLIHLNGERIASGLRRDTRIDGDVFRDFFLDLVAFGRKYPTLVDKGLPLGVGESTLAQFTLNGIASRRDFGARQHRPAGAPQGRIH